MDRRKVLFFFIFISAKDKMSWSQHRLFRQILLDSEKKNYHNIFLFLICL